MTKKEMVALLREARDAVEWDFDWSEHSQASDRKVALDLLSRIDAALAEHDAEERADSATPVVEWEQRQGSYIHDDGVSELRVYLWGDEWHWHTVVEHRASGTCATEDEAKAAAIAAARGMR